MSGELVELRLAASAPTPEAVATAQSALRAAGAALTEIVRTETGRTQRLVVYRRRGRPALRMLRSLSAVRPPGWRLESRGLRQADWLTKWQSAYRPGPMGRTFTVVPLWLRNKRRADHRRPVYIDPQAAFGSGTHETTRIVVGLMEGLEGRFHSCLDVGTGTGVLLVVASRLGAKRLVGVDEDAAALRTARLNLRHNGVPSARLLHGDIRLAGPRGPYDLVAANLLSRTLIEARRRLVCCVRPGGYLAVSGIERRSFEAFLEAFRTTGLRRIRSLRGRRWAGALYRRPEQRSSRRPVRR
ncbi:MAG: Ribosomal protein L11 methyltransferase [Candidatus Omnitrophica bacterium]|nr:Ribosomal protein L11 methyltransferase [Candidatus Omnitrophota bacterium]